MHALGFPADWDEITGHALASMTTAGSALVRTSDMRRQDRRWVVAAWASATSASNLVSVVASQHAGLILH